MKHILIPILVIALTLQGCGSSDQASAALTGASFGGWVGSTVGSLIGGWRGHNIGTLVGMATGAAVGAAATAPKSREKANFTDESYDYHHQEASHPTQDYHPGEVQNQLPTVCHIRFIDDSRDQCISGGEISKLIFEVMNHTDQTIYDIVPVVTEITGNKYITISPSARIERIAAGEGIRYTATIMADKRLKNGTARFRIALSVAGGQAVPIREFEIGTSKKQKDR